jgi:hypothetical protein
MIVEEHAMRRWEHGTEGGMRELASGERFMSKCAESSRKSYGLSDPTSGFMVRKGDCRKDV